MLALCSVFFSSLVASWYSEAARADDLAYALSGFVRGTPKHVPNSIPNPLDISKHSAKCHTRMNILGGDADVEGIWRTVVRQSYSSPEFENSRCRRPDST